MMTKHKSFSEKSVDHDPFIQFGFWYSEHASVIDTYPDSFTLGTASGDGRISVRTVLLKEYGKGGFIFFTNYNSHKGEQLTENPSAAMLFYWPESSRQIRIEGSVEKISETESQAYFASRPRESRIGAWASNQSSRISSREYLETRFSEFSDKYSGRKVPKPKYWGGYRIIPSYFEFWQEGKHRLHDRIIYFPSGSGWKIARLSP